MRGMMKSTNKKAFLEISNQLEEEKFDIFRLLCRINTIVSQQFLDKLFDCFLRKPKLIAQSVPLCNNRANAGKTRNIAVFLQHLLLFRQQIKINCSIFGNKIKASNFYPISVFCSNRKIP